MIITIDGPSGTGKSSVAGRLASRLGFDCFDTGALYRALTLEFLDQGLSVNDSQGLQELLNQFEFHVEGDPKRYFIREREVTEEIRTPRVTDNVSVVAALKPVREKLVFIQKKFAEGRDAVFEGRDMGTVVFPDADLKIFLTATSYARAQRRFLEWQKNKTSTPVFEEVLAQIQRRDHIDSSRELSPLKKADDAFEIDTTNLTLEEVVDYLESLWRKRCSGLS